jgi:hypothetical protein
MAIFRFCKLYHPVGLQDGRDKLERVVNGKTQIGTH